MVSFDSLFNKRGRAGKGGGKGDGKGDGKGASKDGGKDAGKGGDKRGKFPLLLLLPAILAVVVLVVAFLTLFTVLQTTQVLIVRFGEVRQEIFKPGLHAKVPLIDNIVVYDKRTLDIDPPPFEVLLTDKKRIAVDAFARYRIVNPKLYYQRIGTEARLRDRFGKNINAALQRVIATVSLDAVLSSERESIMNEIREEVRKSADSFGVRVIDVRIGRTDLPDDTSQAVFERMRTEREREARELRAQGNESARKIRAQADKEKELIIANATKQSDILRGKGEAARNRLLGRAFSRDPAFFEFNKSLEVYRKSIEGGDTTIIISPDNEFFRYFKRSR